MTVRLQREPFDIAAETTALTAGREDIGAVVSFMGLVRGTTGAQRITAMTIEHYAGMTETEIARIEEEARARWPLSASLIIHRYGVLAVGEPIVLVMTASPHRRAAFEAAQFLMDYLKSRAPFWKKESGPDGNGTWVDAREDDAAALERWTKPNATPD